MNTQNIILQHYASLRTSSQDPIYKEAYDIIAKAPSSFFDDLSEKLNIKTTEILKIFKDFRIVKFFSGINWNFKKLHQLLEQGYENTKTIREVLRKYVIDNKITKFTSENIKKIIDFLDNHPKLKHIIGIGVAALLIYLWFVGFKGINFSTVVNALKGSFKLGKILVGNQGITILKILTVTGVSLIFPWAGMALKTGFAIQTMKKLFKEVGMKLKTSFIDSEQIIINAIKGKVHYNQMLI